MNIESIMEIITSCIKSTKLSKKGCWILIYNDKFIGMDDEFTILYVLDIMPINMIICNTMEKIEQGDYMNYRMYHFILDKYNDILNNSNNMISTCEMNNLELDETFSKLLKLKARDPMHSYIIDNIYIPVFYGYLPINKGDTLDIKAGRMNDGNILVKYTAYKKKIKKSVDIYMRLISVI